MIELIGEVVISVVWELVLQLVGEVLIELGFRTAAEPFRSRERRHPILAAISLAVFGVIVGVVTVIVLPHRVFNVEGVRGASLVLAPLGAAVMMELYGRWREARGWSRSYLATYWGGAIFSYSVTMVRFLLIKP